MKNTTHVRKKANDIGPGGCDGSTTSRVAEPKPFSREHNNNNNNNKKERFVWCAGTLAHTHMHAQARP